MLGRDEASEVIVNVSGKSELVYLSQEQFKIAEQVRLKLGFSRSGFYRYCIMRVLEEMSVLSAKAKEDLAPVVEPDVTKIQEVSP